MLLTGDSLQIKRHIQTESEGMEKDMSIEMKKAGLTILITDKIDFKKKRGCNNHKYLHTQHRST